MVWLHHGHVVSSNRAPEAALPLFIGKVLCSLLIASGMICYLASSSFGVSVGCKVLLSTVFSSFPAVACRSTFCTQNGLPKYAALLCLHFFWDNTRSHPPFLNPWGKYMTIKKFSPPPRVPIIVPGGPTFRKFGDVVWDGVGITFRPLEGTRF